MLSKLSRTFYLPSGGIFYPPLIRIHNISREFYLANCSAFSSLSVFDSIINVIDRYVELTIPAEQLLVSDVIAIWININNFDINSDGDNIIKMRCQHDECKKRNSILLDYGTLFYNQFSKFNPFPLTHTNKMENAEIVFRHRIALDNYTFGYNSIDLNDNDYTGKFIWYIATQVDSIVTEHVRLEQDQYIAFFQSLRRKDIMQMFLELRDFNTIIGNDTDIKYTCQHCRKHNVVRIFDDFILSQLEPATGNKRSLEDFYLNVFQNARLPVYDITEFMGLPIGHADAIKIALDQIKFSAGGVIF